MKSPIARAFYAIYTICIFMPIFLIASIITALTTTIGCAIGNGHFWGYYPGKCWSWLTIRILFLPVRVEGREHLKPGQSYVFVSNHQGAFDIFLIYGFLGRNFKWMMKKGIRKIPLVEQPVLTPITFLSIKAEQAKSKKPMTRHAKLSEKVCLSWCSPKVHVALRVTWASFDAVLLPLPTNFSFPFVR